MHETLLSIVAEFAREVGKAAYNATYYGSGKRVVASSPLLDRWRIVNDPYWPLNWNPHTCWHSPKGAVMVEPATP